MKKSPINKLEALKKLGVIISSLELAIVDYANWDDGKLSILLTIANSRLYMAKTMLFKDCYDGFALDMEEAVRYVSESMEYFRGQSACNEDDPVFFFKAVYPIIEFKADISAESR